MCVLICSTRFGCGWSRFAIVLCSERGGALSVGLLKMAVSRFSLSIIWFVSFGFLLSSHTQTTFSFTTTHTNGRALRARTIGKANVAVVGGALCAE